MAFNGRGSASGTSGNGKESDEDKIKRLKVEKNDYSDLHLTGTSPGIWYLNFGLLYGLLGMSQIYELDHSLSLISSIMLNIVDNPIFFILLSTWIFCSEQVEGVLLTF